MCDDDNLSLFCWHKDVSYWSVNISHLEIQFTKHLRMIVLSVNKTYVVEWVNEEGPITRQQEIM